MFLSNLVKSFLLAVLCAVVLQGCGSTSINQNTNAPVAVEKKGDYPFDLKEPDTYQGDFVVDGRDAYRKFMARKGGNWRRDHYQDGRLWITELKSDKLYSIDHDRKLYTEAPETENPGSFNQMTFDFFKGKAYREFDEVGREGSIVKYKVRPSADVKDDVFIDFDQSSGLIVRQEFKARGTEGVPAGGYLFEIRNLSLNVDDSVFVVPSDYKKVAWDKYRPPYVKPKDGRKPEPVVDPRLDHD